MGVFLHGFAKSDHIYLCISSILATVDIDLQKSVRAFAAGRINLLVDAVG